MKEETEEKWQQRRKVEEEKWKKGEERLKEQKEQIKFKVDDHLVEKLEKLHGYKLPLERPLHLRWDRILNVDLNASPSEIKRQYYKLSRQIHPDKKEGDVELFQLISNANESQDE